MNTFDERAKQWDSDPTKVERAKNAAVLIRQIIDIKPPAKALEFGCGTGLLSFALKDVFRSIDLFDSSQGMLEVLQNKIEMAQITNMHPRFVDILENEAPANDYGIIYSLLTLHHIPDTKRILNRFFEILQPGGLLCLFDLDKEDGTFHPAGTKDILFGFDRKELAKMAEKAGFENCVFVDAMNIRKATDGQEKSFPMFLFSANKPA